jgi:hypothetical protein
MAKFEPITEARFRRLSRRADRDPLPYATEVRFDRRSRKVKLRLSTGLELAFDPRLAHGLADVSEEDLASVQIEGAGGAIHFPRLDADFSVARLLEGFLGPLDWARREARAAASRENGKLGGRPRKVARSEAA